MRDWSVRILQVCAAQSWMVVGAWVLGSGTVAVAAGTLSPCAVTVGPAHGVPSVGVLGFDASGIGASSFGVHAPGALQPLAGQLPRGGAGGPVAGIPCAPRGQQPPRVFTLPTPSGSSWRVGVAAGAQQAFGTACLLLLDPGAKPLPYAPCLNGLSGRLGPVRTLNAQGVTSWNLPTAARRMSADLRILVWGPASPWTEAALSSRLPQGDRLPRGASGFPAGAVVITEFMKDPTAVPDAFGEWFEVYNTSSQLLDLEGWILFDAGIDLAVLDNGGAGIPLAPGKRLVLGREADPFYNGGIPVDVAYQGLTLSNTSDEIYISTPSGCWVDAIIYDDGILWPDQAGRSASLQPGQDHWLSNDDGLHWCSASTPLVGGGMGTPGLSNDLCW